MDDDEEDVHYCLVCNKTVHGLVNYIHHKKNECSGKRNKVKLEANIEKNTDVLHKFENQSFSNESKERQSLNQSKSFQTTEFESFNKQATDNTSFHESFLSGPAQNSLHPTFENHIHEDNSVYEKSVATGTQSTSPESMFISSQINLSTDASVVTLDSNALACSFSPIFATSVTQGKDDLSAVTEDYGILSADISGNRNNQPIKQQDELKIPPSNLNSSSQIEKAEYEQVDDFFQSLELMSRNDRRVDKGGNCHQLPISNILNNLTFSDDEDLGFNFDEDLSLDSASDDSDNEGVPPNYTGGKWKPGEKPLAYKKYRHRYRGKWPPGEGPMHNTAIKSKHPVSRGKNITLIPGHETKSGKKSKKSTSKSSNKTFVCNFCDVTFDNRFKYSKHCSGKQHKENVLSCPDTALKKSEEPLVLKKNDNDESVEDVKLGNKVKQTSETSNLEDTFGNASEETKNETEETAVDEEYSDGYDTDEYFNEAEKKEDTDQFIATPVENVNYSDSVQVLVQVHICTICDKKFQNKYLLARHLLTKFHRNRAITQKEEDAALVKKYQKCIIRLSPYQCAICRFYYTKNEDFEKHLHCEEHRDNCKNLVGEMQCTLCRFKSHSLQEVNEHISTEDHLAKIEKHNRICVIKECHASCTCKFCGIETYSYTRLQQHIKKKHADGKTVAGVKKRQVGVRNRPVCEECGLQLSSPSALQLHVRRQHSKERPYFCECCNTGFSDKHALKSHRKTALHARKLNKNKNEKTILSHNEPPRTSLEIDREHDDYGNTHETRKDMTENFGDGSNVTQKEMEESKEEDLSDEEMEILDTDEDLKNEEIVNTKSNRKRSRGLSNEGVGSSRKNKTFKCNHCDFSVSSYDDLRPHYMKEHSRVIKICELCDVIFLSDKAYKLHVLSKDHQANINASGNNDKDDKKYFQCHVCKKKFTDEKYCKFHTAYQHFHLTTEDAVLKECGYKSITREKYADFLQSITSRSLSDTLKCPDCNTAIKKSNLMVHLRTHTDERPFLCRICPKKFRSNYNLRKHLLGHFGCLERHCDVCGKDFSKPSNFEEHMELHMMEKSNMEKTHICDFCGQSFFLARQLSVHMRRHRKKDLKCDVPGCHWTFAFNNELKTHKMTHSEERPFLCDTCGFAAYSPYHLKRHIRIHSSERKFHCEYCTYKAGNKTHLRRHMRIHIGSKPFKCPYCDFACNTHENIRKHILETKKHEGLKVYPCKFCQFATNSSKDFRGHLMSAHPKETDDGARQVPLSVFTGLFRKHEDLDKPAEGMQVLPCKERKFSRRKINCDTETELKPASEHQQSEKVDKRQKRKRKLEADNYAVQNMAMDMSAKNNFGSYPHEPLRNDDTSMTHQPYPMSLVTNKQVTVPSQIANPSFHQYSYVNSMPGGMPDLGHNVGIPGRMNSAQNYLKLGTEDMINYQDYPTKFDVTRNSNNPDNNSGLVIDMNFSQHH